MGRIGDGYGSEWHLRHYLCHNVLALDASVETAIGVGQIDWRSPGCRPGARAPEWRGLDFLDRPDIQAAWREFWPVRGNTLNWDAIGQVAGGSQQGTWLLVEAKAHLGELRSDCSAKESGGLPLIRRSLARVMSALDVPDSHDWLRGNYQYCNRVAALWFLRQHGVPARLLFVYFIGDQSASGRECPQDAAGWQASLQRQEREIGLNPGTDLCRSIHKIFLPVASR